MESCVLFKIDCSKRTVNFSLKKRKKVNSEHKQSASSFCVKKLQNHFCWVKTHFVCPAKKPFRIERECSKVTLDETSRTFFQWLERNYGFVKKIFPPAGRKPYEMYG